MKRWISAVFSAAMFGFIGCNSPTQLERENQASTGKMDYKVMRDIGGSAVVELPPGLLQAMYKDYEKKGEPETARALKNTYDFETGKLKANISGLPKSASLNPPSGQTWNYYRYDVHQQSYGWSNGNSNCSNGSWCGHKGQGKRLEAFRIKLALPQGYAGSTPTIEYRANVRGLGWLNWVQENEVAGTTGQGRALDAMQVNVSNGFTSWTGVHLHQQGDQGYYPNNAVVPWIDNIYHIESISLYIFQN